MPKSFALGVMVSEVADALMAAVAPALRVRVPVLEPATRGEKVTTMVQVAEAAKEAPQVEPLPNPNSPLELGMDQPPREKAIAEELVRVKVKVEVVPTAVMGKLAGLGVRARAPVTALPVSEAETSATVRVAVLLPTVVGLKTIKMLQVAPAATEVPQPFDTIVNMVESVPETAGAVGRGTAAVPELVTVRPAEV